MIELIELTDFGQVKQNFLRNAYIHLMEVASSTIETLKMAITTKTTGREAISIASIEDLALYLKYCNHQAPKNAVQRTEASFGIRLSIEFDPFLLFKRSNNAFYYCIYYFLTQLDLELSFA